MEHLYGQMEINIMENGKKVKVTGMVLRYGKTEENI